MPMFYMFVASPPVGTSAGEIYREIQPFGPYSNTTGAGFATGVTLGVLNSESDYHRVRAFCRGWIGIAGVESGYPSDDPESPLILSLVPNFNDFRELNTICQAVHIETPDIIFYFGIDPTALRATIEPILQNQPTIGDAADPWKSFRDGRGSVLVDGGFHLGDVNLLPLEGEYRTLRFAVRTGPLGKRDPYMGSANFLDPVVLYHRLTSANLPDGTPAMDSSEVANSWLDVATKDRVLITLRDEWNAPLVSPSDTAVVTGGGSSISTPLTSDRGGTLVMPDGWGSYTCQVDGRKLTPIPSEQGASDNVVIDTSAPSQQVVGTVRPEDWFHPTHPELSDPNKNLYASRATVYTEGNLVEPLIDGFEAFPRLVQDLRCIDDPSHFVLLAGWHTMKGFEMTPGDSGSTLENSLTKASSYGATIRAMIWDHYGPVNTPTVSFINDLPNGKAILDNRTHHHLVKHAGTHHWKCVVVRNAWGTSAHLGGIDINENRLDGPEHLPNDTRYHDVHCRMVGPAVADVTKAFLDRWHDHPDCPPGVHSVTPTTSSPSHPNATCMVQIGRTYGADTQSYAPNGVRTIWATLGQAIGRAKKYIYIEDQYLVYDMLRDELLSALNRIDYLIIVIDGTCDMGIPGLFNTSKDECARARYLFLNPLHTAFPDKLHVFTLRNYGEEYKVHTKVVIIDDVFATIGSANMNRRSMTHDSEVNAFVLDGRVEEGARKFARDLRIRLWAEHLGWYKRVDKKTEARFRVKLADIDRAVECLTVFRPESARLNPYDYSRNAGTSYPAAWDTIVDPDGSTPPT